LVFRDPAISVLRAATQAGHDLACVAFFWDFAGIRINLGISAYLFLKPIL
jgi:hypothetical protein